MPRGRIDIPPGGMQEHPGRFATTVPSPLRVGLRRKPLYVMNPIMANTMPQRQLEPDRWARTRNLGDTAPGCCPGTSKFEPVAITVVSPLANATAPASGLTLVGGRGGATGNPFGQYDSVIGPMPGGGNGSGNTSTIQSNNNSNNTTGGGKIVGDPIPPGIGGCNKLTDPNCPGYTVPAPGIPGLGASGTGSAGGGISQAAADPYNPFGPF